MALSPAPPLESDDPQQLIAVWFADYHGALFRYLVRLLGDEERAADIVQETFLRAFTALGRHPVPTHPFAWLHRIATNLAYTALRRANRWRWLPLSGRERTRSFEGDVATAQTVRACLAHLRATEVEALMLYEYAGFTCAEIAAVTGTSANAIRLRLSRARTRFAVLYMRECTDELS